MTQPPMHAELDALLTEAESKLTSGLESDAAALAQSALAIAPGNLTAIKLLASARIMQNDFAAALTLLEPVESSFESDLMMQLALIDAKWKGGGRPADSLPHYRRVIAMRPARLQFRTGLGEALLAAEQYDVARAEMEKLLELVPNSVEALLVLGRALTRLQRKPEAMEILQRAHALETKDYAAPYHLGNLIREIGNIDDAIPLLREAVRRGPDVAIAHFSLGDALFGRGDKDEGVDHLRRATELDPEFPTAWVRLGDTETSRCDYQKAHDYFKKAVDVARGDAKISLYKHLAQALWNLGRKREAETLAWDWMQKCFWFENRPQSRKNPNTLRVAALHALGRCNTPLDYVLGSETIDSETVGVLENFPYPFDNIDRLFDVVMNAVSEPDAAPQSVALAGTLIERLSLPVINRPSEMAGTMRHLTPGKLAGIPGLLIPKTDRFNRAALRDSPVASLAGFSFPVLLRPIGLHGGDGLEKVDEPSGLAAMLDTIDAEELYVTEFVDFAGEDGLYRKLRMMFVDHEPYPVHLSISEHWLNHYFRTRTADEDDWRKEEARYLQRPDLYLGDEVYEAMRRVARVHDLEYFGFDGAVDRNGKMVVFECNATMMVRHVDKASNHDHKREAAKAIQSALRDVLVKVSRKGS